MKKIIFLSLFTSALYSQNTFPTGVNTNVGIGTTTPTTRLEVIGDVKATSGVFTKSLSGTQTFATNDDRIKATLVLSAGTLLEPTNGVRTFNFMDMPANNFNLEPRSWFSIEDRNDYTRLRHVARTGAGGYFELYDKVQSTVFSVDEDGNNKTTVILPKADSYLGIGTNSFVDGSDVYRLSVKGAIRAHEVKVYTTWADYVFNEDYKLPSLEEVEEYIKLNGHLINVPSASQVESEGLKLGEIVKIQQEKIEELTLYLIQINKELNLLKEQLKTK